MARQKAELAPAVSLRERHRREKKRRIRADRALYAMLIIPIVQILIFRYLPIAGLYISFIDYDLMGGIWGSPFVGLKWFRTLFSSYNFYVLLRNSLILSAYTIIFTFPAPIILALCFNEIRRPGYKRVAQTISYLPYFISTVVVVSLMNQMFSPTGGMVNMFLGLFGVEPIYFMGSAQWFRTMYVGSEIWQTAGWTAIIYMAAISSVPGDLYEAAQIDGAGRLKRIWHVTLPSIMPTILIMLLLKVGHIMDLGYEKVLLMYSPITYEVADIFDTYVYRRGIGDMDYSFSTAVGLFKSTISFVLVVGANRLSNKLADVGLW